MEKATSPFRLPQIIDYTENAISDITSSFHAPRTILTTNCEIAYAWGALPQEIEKIPLCRRNELLARMCVAVSCGLFDSGINYVWNATIIFLRQKIESFGLPFIAQILEKDFSESKLNDMQDSELLDLTLKLNIISEDAFFFLDQCRNIRNNFSAAHPPIGIINGVEFIAFLNRCVRYVLGSDAQNDLHGIDINECIHAVKADIFSEEQKAEWIRRLKTTCDAQRQLIFPILHGIYCDPTSNESARGNAIQICKDSVSFFSNKVISNLLNKHSEYIANGDTKRHNASRSFFTHIGLLHLLSEAERHSIISNALQRLWVAHLELNNFYNEKPFAEQLMHLVLNTEVPNSTKPQLVETVVSCYLGNGYGVANSAEGIYESIIRNFSPQEIKEMFSIFKKNGERPKIVGALAEQQFSKAAKLVVADSVPVSVKNDYDYWKNE